MNTVLNTKIDPELKKQAQQIAKEMGLPISTVVAAGLRQFVQTRSITFSTAPILRPEVEKQILKTSADAKHGKNVSPRFDSVDEAVEWLDK